MACAAGLYAGYAQLTPPSLSRSRDLSTLVLARDGSVLRGFLTRDGKWRLPESPDRVDPQYLRMLVAVEDARFARHPGIDPLAAARALAQLATRFHVVSGASTLTMQAVRLLEKRPRTLRSKLIEMARALALERGMAKEDILAIYLALAPFGGNLEGVRAASLAYFGKEPAHLTTGEAALLVAIPRSPERLRPDRHPEAAESARNSVLDRLAAQGIITESTAAEARQEAVPGRRRPMPFLAPHLAREMQMAAPDRQILRSTIDPLLQSRVEGILRRELASLDPQATLAAIIVDNRERRVLAYVGNADFRAAPRRGTLDMARAVRSPGSALKPFIYAMAFDRLIIHPETLLDDRPRHFGAYAPVDFDGKFQGEVTAREALQFSLNVPAVAVLDRLGPSRFAAALAAADIRLRLPAGGSDPGLPIALGGAGISLVDLTTLYASLPAGGTVIPLRFQGDDLLMPGAAIFGQLGAWYVGEILGDAPPPSSILPPEISRGRRMAFKTGTSYGYRDAWALGFDAEVTIGVWAGRPDGTPMPGRSGRLTAAPVLFRIADLLGPLQRRTKPHPPEGALLVARRDLPPGLRRLDPPRNAAAAPGPKIVYPPDGATVEWNGAELPLEAVGGKQPFRWLVDGRPLPPSTRRKGPQWMPQSIGFVQLSVIDADGKSASARVRLSP